MENTEQVELQERFNTAFNANEKKGYSRKDRVKRVNGQYQGLVKKLNYMARLCTMGRKIGRNTMCPCRSGKKFKHCCIVHHDSNVKKVSRLQKGVDSLIAKIEGSDLRIGVTS
jgi:hypothetical protein